MQETNKVPESKSSSPSALVEVGGREPKPGSKEFL